MKALLAPAFALLATLAIPCCVGVQGNPRATAPTEPATTAPDLRVLPGGNLEVTTSGRTLVYASNGTLIMRDPDATEADIKAADRAVKAHLAE